MTSHAVTHAAGCADCRAGLAHCHGTLLVHEEGGADCTDPACDASAARHTLSTSCAEVGCPCAPPASRRAA